MIKIINKQEAERIRGIRKEDAIILIIQRFYNDIII